MVKRCFVVNCRTGYKSERRNEKKISLFKAPNDKELLEKWRTAVPLRERELTSKDCICEKHFEKRYVIPRFQQSKFGDYYEDHIRPKLARDAVPTIFSGDSNGRTRRPSKTVSSNKTLLSNVLNLPRVEVNDSDTVPICYKCLLGKCSIPVTLHS